MLRVPLLLILVLSQPDADVACTFMRHTSDYVIDAASYEDNPALSGWQMQLAGPDCLQYCLDRDDCVAAAFLPSAVYCSAYRASTDNNVTYHSTNFYALYTLHRDLQRPDCPTVTQYIATHGTL